MGMTMKFILSAALFVIAVITGIWLSRTGRPLNSALFNVHKLIALASVVFAVMGVINLVREKGVSTAVMLLIIAAGIFVAALFVTGALLSAEKPVNRMFLLVHAAAPVLTAGAAAAALYILSGR